MILIIFVPIIFVLSDIPPSFSVHLRQNGIGRKNFKWTPERNAILMSIYHKTKSEGRNHENCIKEMWDRMVPQWKNVSSSALRKHAKDVIYKRGERRTKIINWTPELEFDLIGLYCKVAASGGKGVIYKLHDEFYKKHPTIRRLSPTTLWGRAKTGYESSLLDEAEKFKLRTHWCNEHENDVVPVYREQPPNNKDQARRLHKEWVRLHPEHEHVKPESLQKWMHTTARKRLKEEELAFIERRNWTRNENADLLHIRSRLKMDDNKYTRMLHELWGKMNPDLASFGREKLRKRLKKLTNDHYEPTESENEEAREKFNQLFAPSDFGDHIKRPRREDKGKKKMDPAAEKSATMIPQLQDPHLLQLHEFMSENESHGGPHKASSSRTQYHNQDAVLHQRNYYPDESSNPPSKS